MRGDTEQLVPVATDRCAHETGASEALRASKEASAHDRRQVGGHPHDGLGLRLVGCFAKLAWHQQSATHALGCVITRPSFVRLMMTKGPENMGSLTVSLRMLLGRMMIVLRASLHHMSKMRF
mmetsp:Transcript_23071/g.47480  ORF Transcript_23071/g.47480 Transcript_23071/m.47480 type:complete len:122 (+) Transcript_23071:239-604(+)|eukprot:s8352_g2.t1